MHFDIGGLIWVVIILFFVLSSVSKSLKKAANNPDVRDAVAERAREQLAAQRAQQIADRLAALAKTGEEEVAPPPPRVAVLPVPPPPPRPAAPATAAAPVAPQPAPRVTLQPVAVQRRALFGSRSTLVNAVIASTVLGKPKGDTFGDPW